ncbi:MAG: UDP-N-acetylmuramyl pentapeptide phosphotransferase [Epulopiscium sp.]|jgi:UDP-N-acetylmuramyl pentapeptide phosphotransferase/UDP-N-acetylglucosamine-1-phosphate transferase|nr:UDP-N-acetylmuramyl pentapeptide phosphotransferase [Candidatus Epulonipiscium sp.]
MIFYFIGGLIGFVTSFFWKALILEFLIKYKIAKTNYKQEIIPVGMGILLFFSVLIASFFIIFFTEQPIIYYVFLFGLSLIAFAGLLDDIIDENEVKGLKGHLKKMFNGELTGGGIKAIIGTLIAFYVSFLFSTDIIDLILNILIILFSINSINLFDLRPGRALKIFFLISIIYWIIGDFSDKYLTLLVIGSSLPILKGDLKGQYMLGDVGANILGYTLAFTGMISLNFYYKMISIVLLIVLHIIAETKSISSIINKVPLLRYLDYLGREK